MSHLTGNEPFLSGAPIPSAASGNEPGLGGERGLRQVREYLLRLLEKPTISHLRRAAIGDWLASTGDPRRGVSLTAAGLPDLVWCPVSGGEVHLRDRPKPFPVSRFYVAQYPVTWAQYRIFLEAEDGHENPAWWQDLRRRPEYEREHLPVDNQPAQEVSWYDAVAYCRWLSTRLDHDVRLPTEWEWQQAATGGDPDLMFPWGNYAGPVYANTRESKLRRPTAVGMYPAGVSPVGALDMAGTVLEWCANEYTHHKQASDEERRVLRGGSWFLIFSYARTTFRTGNDPYLRFNSVGFRLAADSLEPRQVPLAVEPNPPDSTS
jgi:hypothetical protein